METERPRVAPQIYNKKLSTARAGCAAGITGSTGSAVRGRTQIYDRRNQPRPGEKPTAEATKNPINLQGYGRKQVASGIQQYPGHLRRPARGFDNLHAAAGYVGGRQCRCHPGRDHVPRRAISDCTSAGGVSSVLAGRSQLAGCTHGYGQAGQPRETSCLETSVRHHCGAPCAISRSLPNRPRVPALRHSYPQSIIRFADTEANPKIG
jgi:hypothetical protein